MSKANWSPEMTTIFCNLAAIEKEKGNRPLKYLNPAGYKNVEVGFFEQTGKHYSRLQFKNKWGSLRTLYRDWLILKNTSTGLGWNEETNTVIADDEWWKKAGEENKDILQFRKCGPEKLNQMSIMYENVNITGESSMMPGCEHDVLDLEDDEIKEEEVQTTQAKKAKNGPWKIDGSSSKKNLVQRDFKRKVDHFISEDVVMNSHKNSVATQIEKIMEEFLACGADEASDEYFIATKLFAKFESRCFFNNIRLVKGRKIGLGGCMKSEIGIRIKL